MNCRVELDQTKLYLSATRSQPWSSNSVNESPNLGSRSGKRPTLNIEHPTSNEEEAEVRSSSPTSNERKRSEVGARQRSSDWWKRLITRAKEFADRELLLYTT